MASSLYDVASFLYGGAFGVLVGAGIVYYFWMKDRRNGSN